MYLKRYHDIQIGHSALYNILKRLGLNRLPASQRYARCDKRWKRYEKQLPGNRVRIDVKFIEPIGIPTENDPAAGQTSDTKPITKAPTIRRRAKYYQFTAIDDCTRLRILRVYPRCGQKRLLCCMSGLVIMRERGCGAGVLAAARAFDRGGAAA